MVARNVFCTVYFATLTISCTLLTPVTVLGGGQMYNRTEDILNFLPLIVFQDDEFGFKASASPLQSTLTVIKWWFMKQYNNYVALVISDK